MSTACKPVGLRDLLKISLARLRKETSSKGQGETEPTNQAEKMSPFEDDAADF